KLGTCLFLLLISIEVYGTADVDYYKLLGVNRDATVKEIRKAFKVLAVKLHPDKNKDDKNADANFIKLARAYEVLKDPHTRKHYDLNGDSPESTQKQQYHSYTYYRDQFGIYDDDPIIVTLSRNDYELNVLDDNQAWFVNFYSPNCHHCHELAPTWRKFAQELEGVIRIAAVNCEDDYALCHQLSIEAYPTLLYYEKESHMYEGEKYIGDRTVEALQEFVLSKLKVDIQEISSENWDTLNKVQWLLFLCGDSNVNCPERVTMIKLAASLEGLAFVGIVKDNELCENISLSHKEKPIVFWQIQENNYSDEGLIHCGRSSALCSSLHVARYPTWGILKVGGAFELHHGRDVLHEVATFARDGVKSTNLHALSPADFYNIVNEETPWFVDWYAPWCPPCRKLLPELRKASQEFEPEKIQFGTIDCTLHRTLCTKEGINSYPTLVLYNGTQTQFFHGVPNSASIAEFVRDMINPLVLSLDDDTFMQILRKPKDELWAVDFYAPWCGPCQKLGPEWRRLAKQVIVWLYNFIYRMYNGNRDAVSLKRWLLSFLPTPVELINAKEFKVHILSKNFYLPWLVDFYAPWCSHCVHFEPEFRAVAQRLEGKVRSAKIDCEADRIFCGGLGITGYPTIRLYLSPTEFYKIDTQGAVQIIRRVKQLIEENKYKQGHDEL
ncbi:hypothetical protein NQ314_001253, partial [Rhamnusium bicolor]